MSYIVPLALFLNTYFNYGRTLREIRVSKVKKYSNRIYIPSEHLIKTHL